MFHVTLQVSPRKKDSYGYFSSIEVATHVAESLTGYSKDNDPVCGVVTEVSIDTSASIAEYKEKSTKAAELTERKQWANFYEQMTSQQKDLMSKFAPASLQDT